MKLCPDCKERLFDEWAKQIEHCSDWWPSDDQLFILSMDFGIYEQEIIPAMTARGWHVCEWCRLWTREELDTEGRCPKCAEDADASTE